MELGTYEKGGYSFSWINEDGDWEWYRAWKNVTGDLNTTMIFNMTLEDNTDNVNEIQTLTLFDDYILVFFNNETLYSAEYPQEIGEQPFWSAYYNNFEDSPARKLHYYHGSDKKIYCIMVLAYPGAQ
eukprot:CAMPEP_0176373188 /NCGR_PEP_ID=MMETSP0126-20121128/25875_1 /TAXON_ID=141414 ORGANISM="Strombidinopsis acuminatum, Strain SPMC142" /NCGR_SAMPLE_ID=MMETSP0126 /ASSEMBLY_ACC=CAM_ASM_000229 /LENGTH=126 /DNA_ID=CAMNT_0017733249 /DNA_START=309 /DNA_END=689 /DNA_ORIENTATION=-